MSPRHVPGPCPRAMSPGHVPGPCPRAISLGHVPGPYRWAISLGHAPGPCPWAMFLGPTRGSPGHLPRLRGRHAAMRPARSLADGRVEPGHDEPGHDAKHPARRTFLEPRVGRRPAATRKQQRVPSPAGGGARRGKRTVLPAGLGPLRGPGSQTEGGTPGSEQSLEPALLPRLDDGCVAGFRAFAQRGILAQALRLLLGIDHDPLR